MSYDPSAAHSFGWQLQEVPEGQEDPRTKPNLNAPPPTKEECLSFRKALDRITKFYSEGESKQEYQMVLVDVFSFSLREYKAQIRAEKSAFDVANRRIQAQLAELQNHAADHPRRKQLEADLNQESVIVQRELRVRTEAEKKLESLYKKRDELVKTFTFLERVLDAHCTSLGVPKPAESSSSSPATKSPYH